MTRALALHHLCATDASPQALVEIAARLGVGDVSLFVRPPSLKLDIFPAIRDEAAARDVARHLRDAGVGLHNIEVFTISPRCDIVAFRADLERGAAMGARRVTALVNDADEGRALANFAAFCALCGELGLAVSIEFMAFSSLTTVEAGAAFVSASGEANATLLVDALHLQRTGGSPARLAAIDPALIGSAQICDAPVPGLLDAFQEAVENRMVPGEGDLQLGDFLEALPAGVPVDMEVPLGVMRDRGVSAFDRSSLVVSATRRLLDTHGLRAD